MPADLRGDLLVTEPVGRLIRRARIVKNEGLTQLRNVYPGSEFITEHRSAVPADQHHDRAGRVDLHRGHVSRHHPGSRTGRGRARTCGARSSSISSTRSSRTGASGACASTACPACRRRRPVRRRRRRRRFRAQPALALDPHAAAHARRNAGAARRAPEPCRTAGGATRRSSCSCSARTSRSCRRSRTSCARSDNLVARFHALWTLEGLGALDVALVREQMKDSNPRMRVQAIRASETLYKAADRCVRRRLSRDDEGQRSGRRDSGAADAPTSSSCPNVEALIKETMASNKARGVQEIGQRSAAAHRERRGDRGGRLLARAAGADEGGRDRLQEPVLDLPRRGRAAASRWPGRRGRRR